MPEKYQREEPVIRFSQLELFKASKRCLESLGFEIVRDRQTAGKYEYYIIQPKFLLLHKSGMSIKEFDAHRNKLWRVHESELNLFVSDNVA